MPMRLWAVLLLVCCCTHLFAQDKSAEKALRKTRKAKAIEQVKPREWEQVRAVSCYQYADSVFPNEALLRLKNLESVHLWGRTWKREGKTVSVPPIRLRIDTVALRRLPHLKYVSLNSFDLGEAPQGLSCIDSLEGLDLDVCGLVKLPPDIRRMHRLRALSLRLNFLHSLPADIGELDSLRSIDLNNNHFREVPMQLVGCAALERIYLSNDETGHGMRHGYEKEYSGPAFDWPFPFCANHIDWYTQQEQLRRLLALPKLKLIRLHARGCEEQKAALGYLGSKQLRFRKPMGCPDRGLSRLFEGPREPPFPYDPKQKDCTCARLGY